MKPGQPQERSLTLGGSEFQTADGSTKCLLELQSQTPPSGAVALILDFSDSFAELDETLAYCSRAIKGLPRRWRLWNYRLSSADELYPDRRLHVEDLFRDFDLVEAARQHASRNRCQRLGSFIEPAIRGILERKAREDVEQVRIVVVSDGELTDPMRIDLPAGVSVLGLTAAQLPRSKTRSWNRVLPDQHLFSTSDSTVDSHLRVETFPFFGPCRLYWTTESGREVSCRSFDMRAGRLGPLLARGELLCDLSKGPQYLVCDTSWSAVSSCEWRCDSHTQPLDNRLELAKLTISDDIVRKLAAAAESESGGNAAFVVEATHEEFALAAEVWSAVTRLTNDRSPWSQLFPLRELVDKVAGTTDIDALLMVGELGESDQVTKLILFCLAEDRAIVLKEDSTHGVPWAWQGSISFNPSSMRWILTKSGQPCELEPYGSEELALIEQNDRRWKSLFCSSLWQR